MNVTYSKEEIEAQISLNDIAVKAGGLNVAEAAVVLSKKLQAALASDQAPSPEAVAD